MSTMNRWQTPPARVVRFAVFLRDVCLGIGLLSLLSLFLSAVLSGRQDTVAWALLLGFGAALTVAVFVQFRRNKHATTSKKTAEEAQAEARAAWDKLTIGQKLIMTENNTAHSIAASETSAKGAMNRRQTPFTRALLFAAFILFVFVPLVNRLVVYVVDLRSSSGDVFFNRGDYVSAEADYSAAIERGDASPEIYSRRGFAQFYQGDYAGAETDFAAAIERGMNTSEVYFNRGGARFKQGDFPNAEADFTAAIERGMDTPGVYAWRGYARYYQEDYVGAIADFTAAIERGETSPSLYVTRGQSKFAQGDYVGAEADLTAVVTNNPDVPNEVVVQAETLLAQIRASMTAEPSSQSSAR